MWLIIICAFIGIGLRLVLAFFFYGNFDQSSYELVVGIMRRGGNIYAETRRYNYSPVWAYVLLSLSTLSDTLNLPFHFVVRTFLSLADTLNGVLIGLISAKVTGRSFSKGALIYLLNPVAILIVGYHGQFDTLAVLPLLCAAYLALEPKHAWWPIWLLGTISLLIKHITIFEIWLLFVYSAGVRRAQLMSAATGMVFIASLLPFAVGATSGIAKHVFAYTPIPNTFGLGILLPMALSVPIFFVVMVLLPLIAERLRLPLVQALELGFVLMLTLIFSIGEQYFILPILVGSIFASRWYWAYTAVTTIFLLGSENNLHLPFVPSIWNTVWLVLLGWALSYFVTWKTASGARADPNPRSHASYTSTNSPS